MITQFIKKTTVTATALVLLISPSIALQGTIIIEPFTCDVALADLAELQRSTKKNNPQFMQEQLEISLQGVLESLAEHVECEVQNEN